MVTKKYTANDICKMTEFLVDNIYVRFSGQLFQQMVGIPMGTNCAPLLADLFLYSYENEILDKLINPISAGGEGWNPPPSRFFPRHSHKNQPIDSKLSDF